MVKAHLNQRVGLVFTNYELQKHVTLKILGMVGELILGQRGIGVDVWDDLDG